MNTATPSQKSCAAEAPAAGRLAPHLKTSLEGFYKGFAHFSGMDHQGAQIVFRTGRGSIKSAMAAAQRRISQLQLPLVVRPVGPLADTFVVAGISQQPMAAWMATTQPAPCLEQEVVLC